MLTRDTALCLLAEHRQTLASFGLRHLAVFGSVARDAAGPDSDVDVLVEFDGQPTFDRYVGLGFYLENLLGRPVDLVTRSSLREFMRDAVEREAVDVQGLPPLPR